MNLETKILYLRFIHKPATQGTLTFDFYALSRERRFVHVDAINFEIFTRFHYIPLGCRNILPCNISCYTFRPMPHFSRKNLNVIFAQPYSESIDCICFGILPSLREKKRKNQKRKLQHHRQLYVVGEMARNFLISTHLRVIIFRLEHFDFYYF